MHGSRIQSFLSDRTQKCQLADKMPSEKNVKCGVPQGSILAPLFFHIYINDFRNVLTRLLRLFADDTNLTVAGETIGDVELAMNNDLTRINEWLLANKLTLNVTKILH